MDGTELLSGDTPEVVMYKEADEQKLSMLIVKPKDWKPGDKRPAILWIHGGGWTAGNAYDFVPHCRFFAMQGLVSVSIEYRLIKIDEVGRNVGKTTIKECISDCKSAIRYLRHNSKELGIDPDRIAAGGDSAGGHLALSIGTIDEYNDPNDNMDISSVPNIIIDCNGITDMTHSWKKFIPEISEPDRMINESQKIDRWLKRHKLAKELSPVFNIKSGQPPVLILHGLEDKTVIPEDSFRFYEAYRRTGNEAEIILYSDCRHAFILFNYTATEKQVMEAIMNVYEYLVKKRFADV